MPWAGALPVDQRRLPGEKRPHFSSAVRKILNLVFGFRNAKNDSKIGIQMKFWPVLEMWSYTYHGIMACNDPTRLEFKNTFATPVLDHTF